jgi:ribonuclease I
MVCEVVMLLMWSPALCSDAHGRGVAAAQDDVEFIAQHLVAHRLFQLKREIRRWRAASSGMLWKIGS